MPPDRESEPDPPFRLLELTLSARGSGSRSRLLARRCFGIARCGPSARSARCSWNGASRVSESSKNDPYVIVDDVKLGAADMTLGGRGYGDGWM